MRLFLGLGVGCAAVLIAACGSVSSSTPDDDGGVDGGGGGPDASLERYAVGGTVTGLSGEGLVLRQNGGDDLPVTVDGTFTFATELATGTDFAVTVAAQPTNPQQTCTVSGGTGTVGTADVTSVTVECTTDLFTIGGTVSGLVGEATLEVDLGVGGNELVVISAEGTYAFPMGVPMGTTYVVTIQTQSPEAVCIVRNGTGTVPGADVTNVNIACAPAPALTLSGVSCDVASGVVSWEGVAGAIYTVSFGPRGGSTPEEVTLEPGETSFTPPFLAPGEYEVRVRPELGGLEGPWSTTLNYHVASVPSATASNSGAACVGGSVTLSAGLVDGATYAWTGPGGFTSTERTPVLTDVGGAGAAAGLYQVVVTADGCEATASTNVVATLVNASFTQTSTAQFGGNSNASVFVANNEVRLTDNLDFGAGTANYNATANTTLAGGTYEFANFTIASGVTVTVTGNTPLVIRATGTVNILGTLDASGKPGTNAVTFMNGGVGGAGVAGGGNGADGLFTAGQGPLPGTAGSGSGKGAAGANWSGGSGGGHAVVGGTANNGPAGGVAYGSAAITGTEAGSGGGSGSYGNNCGSGGGGGGGGYVRISAPTISIPAGGSISVNGGNGGSDGNGSCGGGGGGSGGTIHLRARTLSIPGKITATGGSGGSSSFGGTGGIGAVGRIRVDAPSQTLTGTISPTPGVAGDLVYASSGTSRTGLIQPANQCSWGVLTFNRTVPAGAAFQVNVLSSTNTLLLGNVASGSSLDGLIAVGTPIRLEAVFTGPNASATLFDWTLAFTTR